MSWQPLNLAAPQFAQPSEPPATCGLLYRGKRHALSGQPESAKTLLAMILLLEEQRAGGPVALVDFESGPAETRRLLEDLGATSDEVGALIYVEPDGPPSVEDLDALVAAGVTLVCIDALAGAYDVAGLDDNKRADAERFAAAWIRPLWQQGVATLALDHVAKNAEARSRWVIGSERKLGGVDVHLGLSVARQLHRGGNGLVRVATHKDRPGWLNRPHALEVELRSDPATHAITWAFRQFDADTDTENGWQPTHLMEKVSRFLEAQAEPVNKTRIPGPTRVSGKREYVLAAVEHLHAEGYIEPVEGSRGATAFRSVKPYRDPKAFPVPNTFPDVPGNARVGRSPFPPSLRGNGNAPDHAELERLIRKHADLTRHAS